MVSCFIVCLSLPHTHNRYGVFNANGFMLAIGTFGECHDFVNARPRHTLV